MKTNVYNQMGFKSKDECYTSYAESKKLIDFLIYHNVIDQNKTVWLPFDNQLSNIYKSLNKNKIKTILTNLEIGLDFYNHEPSQHYDIIITNPPFSNRTNLLKRMFSFKKPFIILQGTQFFNNQYAVKYLIQYQYQLTFLMPRTRMNFLTYNNELDRITSSKSAASFYSFWIAYKTHLLPGYQYLEDNNLEKEFEQYDLKGNRIIDNHLNLFTI